MKLIRGLAVTAMATVLFASCKKDDSPAPYGKVTMTFANTVAGQPLSLGPIAYTNAAGNKYSVDMLKYYVSNFRLVKADGSEQPFGNYELIDASKPETLSFDLDSVLNGDFTAVKFILGIDSSRNHSGAQDGDLDPVNGMLWTWNTGYIFYKHEGNYVTSAGDTSTVVLHLGTDQAPTAITVPIPKLSVAGNTRKLYLDFDLNSAYTSATGNMDFNTDNFRMSSGVDDFFWIIAMKANLVDAFSYKKAE